MSSTFSEIGFENLILKGTFIELGVFRTVKLSLYILIYFQAKRYRLFKRPCLL